MTTNFNDVKAVETYVCKVLPLVYDDSISYYEQLSRVAESLNKVIENNNNIPEYLKELILQFIENGVIGEIISQMIANFMLNVKYPPSGLTPAVGDGTKDDTEALQGCIDYASTHEGMNVYFPSGSYLTSALTVKNKVSLIGASQYNTKIVLKGGATKALLNGAVSGVEVSKLTLDGNAGIQVNDINVVDLIGSDYLFNDLILTDGHNLINIDSTAGLITLNNVSFLQATVKHCIIGGLARVKGDSLYFKSISGLYGLCSLEIDLTDAVFNDIVAYATVPNAFVIAGTNNTINATVHNAVSPYDDNGTGTNITINGISNIKKYSGNDSLTAANSTETITGNKTIMAASIDINSQDTNFMYSPIVPEIDPADTSLKAANTKFIKDQDYIKTTDDKVIDGGMF